MKRNRFITILPGAGDRSHLFLLCLLAFQTILQVRSALHWGHDNWQLTEWLINYSGGFVRRGLPGELAGWISNATGIAANKIVILSALLCFLSLGFWFLRHSAGHIRPALVASCVLMGFPAYQDSIIRKDCLGLLLFIACIRADASRLPVAARITLVNLLACTAILCHEAFAMYALPALWLYPMFRDGPPGFRKILARGAAFMPAAACFFLTVRFHGTEEQSRLINQSWLPLWRITDPGSSTIGEPSAAISAVAWTAQKGASLGLTLLSSGIFQPLAWLALFGISFVLIVGFSSNRTRVAAILLLQLPCISPLFILGYDYGRWLFLWAGTSLIILATGLMPPGSVENALASFSRRFGIGRLAGLVPSGSWPLFCFGVPVCWNLHAFLTASPIGRIIQGACSLWRTH